MAETHVHHVTHPGVTAVKAAEFRDAALGGHALSEVLDLFVCGTDSAKLLHGQL